MDWTKNIVILVQNDAFFPHPIRRELKPLMELFTEKNFGHVQYNKSKIDVQKIVPWLTEYYTKYCDLFELECNVTGCGINDECSHDHFCTDLANNEMQCGLKVSEVFLRNGQRYFGEINEGMYLLCWLTVKLFCVL